jgi:hypothetical protein
MNESELGWDFDKCAAIANKATQWCDGGSGMNDYGTRHTTYVAQVLHEEMPLDISVTLRNHLESRPNDTTLFTVLLAIEAEAGAQYFRGTQRVYNNRSEHFNGILSIFYKAKSAVPNT